MVLRMRDSKKGFHTRVEKSGSFRSVPKSTEVLDERSAFLNSSLSPSQLNLERILAFQGLVGNRTVTQLMKENLSAKGMVQRKPINSDPRSETREKPSSTSSSEEVEDDPELTNGSKIVVYFEKDHDQPHKNLEKINTIILIAKDPKCRILVSGHASAEGTASHNLRLSERRAQAVKSLLIVLGLRAKQIETKAYGELSPAVEEVGQTPGELEEKRQKNRRVEIQLLYEGSPNQTRIALQNWLNKALRRLKKNFQVTLANYARAKERLEKINKNTEVLPYIQLDVLDWVDKNTVAIEYEQAHIQELEEASFDPGNAEKTLSNKVNITQKSIEYFLNLQNLTKKRKEDADTKLNMAKATESKAAYKEMSEFYAMRLESIKKELKYLRSELQGDKGG